ncbi:hypothetical protein [Nocardia sp. NPDC020380]|uniref:hypothetical protein n=1 Tax=Nocardia sp. NPDC020380 TaxID=3364309 RepID=UPI0037A0DE94
MPLDILAFSLAALNLTVVTVMLVVGLTDMPSWPSSVRCRLCARWMVDMSRGPTPTCLRCRLRPSSGERVQSRGGQRSSWNQS